MVDGGLQSLVAELKQCDFDLLMFDSETQNELGGIVQSMPYLDNPREMMTGEDYLANAKVPWVPWLTAYKRTFLNKSGIRYAEYVRFEDTDYVLKCCLLAETVCYRPLKVTGHVVNPVSTVHIGGDAQKVGERFLASVRLYDTIIAYGKSHPVGVKCLKGHYDYMYCSLLKGTLWRLKMDDIRKILKTYPYRGDTAKGIVCLSKYPVLYSFWAKIASPLFRAGIRIRNMMR